MLTKLKGVKNRMLKRRRRKLAEKIGAGRQKPPKGSSSKVHDIQIVSVSKDQKISKLGRDLHPRPPEILPTQKDVNCGQPLAQVLCSFRRVTLNFAEFDLAFNLNKLIDIFDVAQLC